MKGYRGMISDRVPLTWDLALKYCKAKTRWIEYVYTKYIMNLPSEYRRKKVLQLVGKKPYMSVGNAEALARTFANGRKVPEIEPKDVTFTFRDTILFAEINDNEELLYWSRVADWVEWFSKNYQYVENSYKTTKLKDKEFKSFLIEEWHVSKECADYLLKCLKHK